MKTFEEAMLKLSYGGDVERDPYRSIVAEATNSVETRKLVIELMMTAMTAKDPKVAIYGAFATGLMVGIEMEKP